MNLQLFRAVTLRPQFCDVCTKIAQAAPKTTLPPSVIVNGFARFTVALRLTVTCLINLKPIAIALR